MNAWQLVKELQAATGMPCADSVRRGVTSGVKYIAEPGGSIRDDLVIEECSKNGIVMAFTGMRFFHH